MSVPVTLLATARPNPSQNLSLLRWDIDEKQPVHQSSYEGHADWVNDCVVVNDLLLTCSNDSVVRVWKTNIEGKGMWVGPKLHPKGLPHSVSQFTRIKFVETEQADQRRD